MPHDSDLKLVSGSVLGRKDLWFPRLEFYSG